MTLSAGKKGVLLGVANVLAVASFITVMLGQSSRAIGDPEELGYVAPLGPADAFAIVLVLGMIPGILAGLCLGRLAGALDASPLVRRLALAIPSLFVVLVLGGTTQQLALVLPALLPTAVAVLALERWTRR